MKEINVSGKLFAGGQEYWLITPYPINRDWEMEYPNTYRFACVKTTWDWYEPSPEPIMLYPAPCDVIVHGTFSIEYDPKTIHTEDFEFEQGVSLQDLGVVPEPPVNFPTNQIKVWTTETAPSFYHDVLVLTKQGNRELAFRNYSGWMIYTEYKRALKKYHPVSKSDPIVAWKEMESVK